MPTVLLVVAPHQDDEILGCGLLMRRVEAAGGKVVIAWLTDGGNSNGDLAPDDRQALVRRRKAEALDGLKELNVQPVATVFLGFPDGYLGADTAHLQQARQRLQALCDTHGVDAIVVTDANDGHPDHQAAYRIASELDVACTYSYPISARYDGEVYTPPLSALAIAHSADDQGLKRAALRRHVSQRQEEGAIFPMSEATIQRFCTEPELFIPVRSDARHD